MHFSCAPCPVVCLSCTPSCYVFTGLSYLITLLDSLSLGLSFFHHISHPIHCVTDLQGPPSERTQMKKIRDLKSLARQYARDRGSCDDTRISYLEYVESEAEADWTLARMIAG
jgi:hypothetical protein